MKINRLSLLQRAKHQKRSLRFATLSEKMELQVDLFSDDEAKKTNLTMRIISYVLELRNC